jgi:hypothetical protein
MTSDDQAYKLPTQGGEMVNYFPTKNVYIPVNREKVLKSGMVPKEFESLVGSDIKFTIPRNGIMKNDLMVLDLIANNNWERPIYFTISMGPDSYLGLQEHFQLEGLNYRLVPYRTQSQPGETYGSVNTEAMYNNLMNKFKWGGMNQGIYIDPETSRMTINLRSNFIRLAEDLLTKGDSARCIKVLDKCDEVMPNKYVPYLAYNYRIGELYFAAGAFQKGEKFCTMLFDMYENDIKYFMSLNTKMQRFYERDIQNGFAIMQELTRIAKMYKQDKLAAAYEKRFAPYAAQAQAFFQQPAAAQPEE